MPAEAGYDALVARSRQGSVFATSWWLEAVAPGRWRPNSLEDAGRVVAAWPTVVRRTRLGEVHAGAPLTPFLGPLLEPGEGQRRRSREIEHVERLLERFRAAAHVEARCNPGFDYWTPLHWHGFAQTTHYTWRLADLADPERVFAGARENVRREVRKAAKRGIAVTEGGLAELLPLLAVGGAERGGGPPEAILRRVDAAAAERGARTILLARDPEGRLHSGAYFVHDDRFTYYLLGASASEHRTSGAASLVMWKAIESSSARRAGFDFEGSMLRPVERFVRAFGGEPTPYSIVHRTSSRAFAVARTMRRALRRRA